MLETTTPTRMDLDPASVPARGCVRAARPPRPPLTVALLSAIAAIVILGISACGMGGHGGVDTTPVLPEFTPRTPNDSHYHEQWNMEFIEMPDAWGVVTSSEIRRRSRVVYVAVLDTQIEMTHPDLEANLVDGWDFVDNQRIRAGSGAAGGTDHGTHVAGIIAAGTNNKSGIAGVGWDRIRIIPVRVLNDDNSGSTWTVTDGILYAAGLPNSSGRTPARRADVINMSLGGPSNIDGWSAVEDAATQAADRGITLVASSGNNGSGENGILHPAALPNVVAVGSVNPPPSEDEEPARSEYSDYGMGLEFVAPGGSGEGGDPYAEVYSTLQNGGYGGLHGTSMAAPHVSGLAALLYSVADSMTQNGVRSVLRQTATAIAADESYPHPEFGYGLIHAGRAVRRALMQPHGPYQFDNEVSLQSLAVSTTEAGSLESGLLETSRQQTAHSERAEPEPGSYRPDRLIVSLDSDWLRATPQAERRARLEAIVAEHRLESISGAHLGHALARLSAGQDAAELRRALIQEPEIAEVSFDLYVSAD